MVKLLRYEMLSDEEKLEYAEIVNKADPNWAKKADNAEEKTRSLWRTLFFGLPGYTFHGIEALYHVSKNLYDSNRMEKFIEQMKTKYECSEVDIDSFPSNWLMPPVSLYKRIPWGAIEAAGNYEAQKEILQPIIDDTLSNLTEKSRKDITEMILNYENMDEEKFFTIIGEKRQEEEDRQFLE